MALKENSETFLLHKTALKAPEIIIHACSVAQMAVLKVNKAYTNFY